MLCGCAPKGIFVSLPDEQAPSSISKKTKIYIESVKDVRAFENDPKQASTPSLYKHKLWTYLTLGAVKVGLNADISTTLSVNNKELNTVVKRKEEYLLVNQNDYANIIKSSLAEYKEKLAKQISELNLE